MNKIAFIRAKFPDKVPVHNIPLVQKTEIRSKINSFERATEDKIKKLMLSSSTKSCDLDHIPTNVLKYFLDILVTPITDIINISTDTSTSPKKSQKRMYCLKSIFSYRPVSYLSFISKTLEKVVADWLQAHIKNTRLSNPLQSTYTKHHST